MTRKKPAVMRSVRRTLIDGTTISTMQKPFGMPFETELITANGVGTVVEQYASDLEASIGHTRWCSYISSFLTATGGGRLVAVEEGEGWLGRDRKKRRFALREDV